MNDSDESDEEDQEEGLKDILEETKGLQKLRKRPHGVSVVGLTLGTKVSMADELSVSDDPFKLKKGGGMIDMHEIKGQRLTDTDGTSIGTAFSTETNRRDEDAEMMKYIDGQLARRKGVQESEEKPQAKRPNCAEDALYEVPEHLRISSSKRSEEMLSNQMLSGIPEVDLGIDVKIKNIEATEDAKQRLLRERMKRKDGPSQFVPTNMAVNFVQHNRFNIEDPEMPKPRKKKEVVKPVPLKVGDAEKPLAVRIEEGQKQQVQRKPKDPGEKATDDFHFEKFKKQFKRY